MKLRYTPPAASGGTATAYTLSGVKVTRFNVENLYEGDGFNRTGRKQTIEGTGYIEGNPFTSSSGAIDLIRNQFNAPRGKLELQFDDATGTWYTLANGSDDTSIGDTRNGPIPSVNITDIHGGSGATVSLVSFTYSFFGCGGTRIQRFDMSVSQSIDEAGFITMTRSGTITVSNRKPVSTSGTTKPYTNSNPEVLPSVPTNGAVTPDAGNSPDMYRALISGKPFDGFRRMRQDYTVSADLRTLTFSIEDRLVFRELKYPVLMGDASFSYERGLDNMLGTKNFIATFEGDVKTEPRDLLKVAIEAAASRIDFKNDLVQSISVTEPNIFTRNKIELKVTAQGQSETAIDPSTIKAVFSDPHAAGSTKYVSAYPNGGTFVADTSGLIFDPCILPDIIQTVVYGNAEDKDTKTLVVAPKKPDAEVKKADGTTVTKPVVTDSKIKNTNNAIKHLETETIYNHADSGLDMLETCGGIVQFPFQTRLPVVIVKQTVKMVATERNPPIPWEDIREEGVVITQQISIKNTTVDASGKATFAIVAVREIRLNVASSTSTRRYVDTDGSGRLNQRKVFAPASVNSPRSLYASGNTYDAQSDYTGTASVMDYFVKKNASGSGSGGTTA